MKALYLIEKLISFVIFQFVAGTLAMRRALAF